MFETRTELKNKLAAATARIDELESELSAAQSQADESASTAQRVAELEEDLKAATDELTAEQNAHAETRASLEAEQAKTTDEAINALVVARLAEAGHPVIEMNAETETEEPSLHSQYRTLQSEDPHKAAEFWEKNKEAILAEH